MADLNLQILNEPNLSVDIENLPSISMTLDNQPNVEVEMVARGPKGETGATGATGSQGIQGVQGEQGIQGIQGATGASITSGAFVADDLVFTKDDATTVSIVDAKIDLKGDQGIQGIQGVQGDPGAGVTPQTVGFTITGGTTPKTLTVSLDADVSGTNTGDQTLPTRDSLGLDTDDTVTFANLSGTNTGDDASIPAVTPGDDGNVLTSDGTNWVSEAPPVSVSVTTKGDLQTYSTAPERLAKGTDGYILESRDSETTGLRWIPSPETPAGSIMLISQVFS